MLYYIIMLEHYNHLRKAMDLILKGVELYSSGVSDRDFAMLMGIHESQVGEFREFMIKLGFVGDGIRLNIGEGGEVDVGLESKELYVTAKGLLLDRLKNGGSVEEIMKSLDLVQRYQAFMLKSQEKYHNINVFRRFQEIVLEEVGKFDEGVRLELLGKVKELMSRRF